METIVSRVNSFKEEYYKNNKKNALFKEKQKAELAALIIANFNVDELIEASIRNLENTNKVYIDYTIFKLYANESVYNKIIETILNKFDIAITKYGNFECHINIEGFTITAAQRYQGLIGLFCDKCVEINSTHTDSLVTFNVYYPPHIMDPIRKILTPFIHKDIKHKINIISKENSESQLKLLNL